MGKGMWRTGGGTVIVICIFSCCAAVHWTDCIRMPDPRRSRSPIHRGYRLNKGYSVKLYGTLKFCEELHVIYKREQ